MIANGEEIQLEKPVRLPEFLKQRNYPDDRIAIELNGRILPKREYGSCMLDQNDKIEIVCFVGGG